MQYKESRYNNQQPTLQLPQILEFFFFFFFTRKVFTHTLLSVLSTSK